MWIYASHLRHRDNAELRQVIGLRARWTRSYYSITIVSRYHARRMTTLDPYVSLIVIAVIPCMSLSSYDTRGSILVMAGDMHRDSRDSMLVIAFK